MGRYVYDLKHDTVQPCQKLVPPAVECSSGTTTAIAFAGVGSGGEGVVAQGMSSGHVIVWRLPSSLAANGAGEGDDVEVLNSMLGAEGAEDGSATDCQLVKGLGMRSSLISRPSRLRRCLGWPSQI